MIVRWACLELGTLFVGIREEGGMNKCGDSKDDRQKGVLEEASPSWYYLWVCPMEKARTGASTQLADGECARMCRRGTQRCVSRGGAKIEGCSLIRYGTKEG